MLATIQPFFTLSKCLRVTTFLVPGVCLFVGRKGGRREEEGGGGRRRKEEEGGRRKVKGWSMGQQQCWMNVGMQFNKSR